MYRFCVCSECEKIFSLERMEKPSLTELHKIDGDFRLHCQRIHPGSPVVGLSIADPRCEPNAARIVKEATEGR